MKGITKKRESRDSLCFPCFVCVEDAPFVLTSRAFQVKAFWYPYPTDLPCGHFLLALLKGKHPRARLPVRQLLQSPFDVDHTEVQTCTSGKKSMNTSSVIGMYGWGFCREGTESGKRLCRDQPTADQPNGWLKSPPVVVFVTVTVNAVMYAGHGSNHSSSQCTSHCNPLPLTTALLCPNFGCNYMSNLQICTCHCLCHYLPKTYAVITCPIC